MEDTIDTPFGGPAGMRFAEYWYDAQVTPDYFSAVYIWAAPVPNTGAGYQLPHHGFAFGGEFVFKPSPPPDNWREYMGVGLIEPLKTGKKYCLEFWVNLPDNAILNGTGGIDRLGAYFSNDTVGAGISSGAALLVSPQVENVVGNIITDTVGWTQIQGELIASGGEKIMTVGNFRSNAATQFSGNGFGVYYFFDDFSLVLVPDISYPKDFADAGEDKNICPAEGVQLGTPPIPGCHYSWQPTTGLDNDTLAQPIASPAQTTNYILTVQTYSTVCRPAITLTDTVTVFIEECPIEAVNIFTPNNDGKNEYFVIKNLPPNSKLLIFNRWGSKVYSSDNYDPEYSGWDGGKVPDGTYFYILTLQNKKTYHGFVEIRR